MPLPEPSMLKRKFNFNLTPIKVPSRTETKALKDALGSHHASPAASPFIHRPLVDPKIEEQLRDACAVICLEQKTVGPEYDARKHAQALREAASRRRQERGERPHVDAREAQAPRVRDDGRPNPLASHPHVESHPSKYAYKPEANLDEVLSSPDCVLPVQANTSRRRERAHIRTMSEDTAQAFRASVLAAQAEEQPTRIVPMVERLDRPRTAPTSEPADESFATPLSASTDGFAFHNGSTAPTTAPLTPAKASTRASKRMSQQHAPDQDSAQKADAAAAEWMRQELEKRREAQAQAELQVILEAERRAKARQAPPPSRSNSVTRRMGAGIREYFRPGERMSRKTSQESMRPRMSEDEPPRASSAQGWRNWGMQRSGSVKGIERLYAVGPGTVSGRTSSERPATRGREPTKPAVDLNRPLPALPSLDQWKDEESEAATSPIANHVVELVRPRTAPGNADEPRSASTARSNFENRPPIKNISRHDSALTNDGKSVAHTKANSNSSQLSSPITKVIPIKPMLMEIPKHSPHKPRKESLPTHNEAAPNFSRKISLDSWRQHHFDQHSSNVVEITALPRVEPDARPRTGSGHDRGLRKMFSSFSLGGKKSRKQQECAEPVPPIPANVRTAVSPVVRY